MQSRLFGAMAAVALSVACAKELPPPGSHPDLVPPRIASIEPAPDSVVAGFDGGLRIRFDEPVNIPTDLARRMFASPMEPYQMETGFSDMRLRPRAGWRQGIVYCYSIPEGVADLLRNRIEDTTEFCFSTGPAIANTRVTGTITDAITGLPQNEARVAFIGLDSLAAPTDSVTSEDRFYYGALTDTEGRFSARSLPPGEYQAIGFIDQNRNFTFQRSIEAYDSATFVSADDNVPNLVLNVVPPDSTPPVLLRVLATDRVTIQLEFDDYLLNPPETTPQIVVRDSTTNLPLAVIETLVGQVTQVTFTSSEPVPDTIGVAVDSLAAADEPAFVAPDSLFGALEDTAVLPTRFVSVRLGVALDSTTYLVETSGVVNVRRLAGESDTTFVAEPPPPPPPPVPDSLGVGFDTLSATDSTTAGIDTLSAPGDTVFRRRRARR